MPWEVLLGGAGLATQMIEMRLIRKRGEPLLLLPRNSRLAKQTLALYPAQTSKARTLKRIWDAAFAAGLPFFAKRVSIPICPTNPFVKFLGEAVAASTTPRFGFLAGNARTPGQRFVFLVFTEQGQPSVVVKAGASSEAKGLIRREKDFLTRAATTPGVPTLRKTFESSEVEALVLDFVEGGSPRELDEQTFSELLGSWLNSLKVIPIRETKPWIDLEKNCGEKPLFRRLAARLADKIAASAIFHGDFAPWNIKVSRAGKWIVLDWERSELIGPPAWDWFHFVFQPAILVHHFPTAQLMRLADQLMASPAFKKYSEIARLQSWEREWVLAYLLYQQEVIRPAEGSSDTGEFLETLASKWLPN